MSFPTTFHASTRKFSRSPLDAEEFRSPRHSSLECRVTRLFTEYTRKRNENANNVVLHDIPSCRTTFSIQIYKYTRYALGLGHPAVKSFTRRRTTQTEIHVRKRETQQGRRKQEKRRTEPFEQLTLTIECN